MGIFDIFSKKSNAARSVKEIINTPFSQQYFDECKLIWKNYVPKSGQASTLQGELLREIEKIRCEAQDNGNINWDDDYSYFCDFITDSLSGQTIFSAEEKAETKTIMAYLKQCGKYSESYNAGNIPEDALNPNKLAYTEDTLYDIICDKIGKLQREHPEPIPYEKNNTIHR